MSIVLTSAAAAGENEINTLCLFDSNEQSHKSTPKTTLVYIVYIVAICSNRFFWYLILLFVRMCVRRCREKSRQQTFATEWLMIAHKFIKMFSPRWQSYIPFLPEETRPDYWMGEPLKTRKWNASLKKTARFLTHTRVLCIIDSKWCQ